MDQQPKIKQPFKVKVYLVSIPINTAGKGDPNRKIIAAKLSWASAKSIKDHIPGAQVEKVYADKESVDISIDLPKLESMLKNKPTSIQ